MRLIILIAILLCSSTLSFSQDQNVFFSEPVDVSLEGWNKLLLLKNGNTMLFHFQNRKGIVVKVYDKDHKEIASQKHLCNLLDINVLEESNFDGLLEVNGEATLFVTQDIFGKETLLRLRFNSTTAKLIKEEKAVESPSFKNNILTYVIYNSDSQTYSILCYQKKSEREAQAKIRLISYGKQNEVVKEVGIDMSNADFDYIHMLGGALDKTGATMIVFRLTQIIKYPDVNDEWLRLLYLPMGADSFVTRDIKLQRGYMPSSARYRYNAFAGNFNLFLTSINYEKVTSGNHSIDFAYNYHVALVLGQGLSNPRLTALNDELVNQYAKENLYTKRYDGKMIGVNTNERGLTTIISENQFTFHKTDNVDLSKNNGDFGITMYDDNGKEIWATILPRSRYYKLVATKDVSPRVFGMLSQYGLYTESVYQLKNNAYIIYNELEKNFDKSIADTLLPISDFGMTHSVYYQIDRKKEVTKKYLFGQPQEGIYQQAYFNSDDIDEKTGNYAVMFLRRKGKDVTTHIAWLHFDI